MVLFPELLQAIANILGTDVVMAGWIAGAALAFSLFIAILILSSILDLGSGSAPLLIALTLGVILAVGFGWWDAWVALLIAMLLVFLIVNPFGGD